MPVQPRLAHTQSPGGTQHDGHRVDQSALFLWSVSLPGLELLYLSPSTPLVKDDADRPVDERGPVTRASWADKVTFPGEDSGQSIITTLWTRGLCEFDFAVDAPGNPTFRCRAILARDINGEPRRIDGVAVSRPPVVDDGVAPMPVVRLSDLGFASVAVDADLRVVAWPSVLSSSLGISATDAVQASLTSLFRLESSLFSPVADPVAIQRDFLNGEAVLASANNKQVLLHHFPDPSARRDRQRVIVTILGALADDPVSAADVAWSRLSSMLRNTAETVLVVDPDTLAILDASRGAAEVYGLVVGQLTVSDLEHLAPELAEIVRAQRDYLDTGCTVAVNCPHPAGDPLRSAFAQVRLSEVDSSNVLVIRVHDADSEIAWGSSPFVETEAESADVQERPQVASLLVDRGGNCHVITAQDEDWRTLLEDALVGGLPSISSDPDTAKAVIQQGFEGLPGNLEVSVAGTTVACHLRPFLSDSGMVVSLVGDLVLEGSRR